EPPAAARPPVSNVRNPSPVLLMRSPRPAVCRGALRWWASLYGGRCQPRHCLSGELYRGDDSSPSHPAPTWNGGKYETTIRNLPVGSRHPGRRLDDTGGRPHVHLGRLPWLCLNPSVGNQQSRRHRGFLRIAGQKQPWISAEERRDLYFD